MVNLVSDIVSERIETEISERINKYGLCIRAMNCSFYPELKIHIELEENRKACSNIY